MRPVFADPKTDVIFRKIFGEVAHKPLLIALLNALLELDEVHSIVDVDYLSARQRPPREDLKLSVLDVECTDARGAHYVVELQIIDVDGFQKRVVCDACTGHTTQLSVGDEYPALNDVIAVIVCDVLLWPERDVYGEYRVPMLSRWRLPEQHRPALGLGEVRYVFLELPKYAAGDNPQTTAEKWAWFFRSARSLPSVPTSLAPPYTTALGLAHVANLTEDEWTEYEREKMAEQDFRGGLSLAYKRGIEAGEKIGIERVKQREIEKGEKIGIQKVLRTTILDLCEAFGVQVTPKQIGDLEHLDAAALEQLRQDLKRDRVWPPSR